MTKIATIKDREKAVAEYARNISVYERFSDYICSLVGDHCGRSLIHATEHRAKSKESFEKKCYRRNSDGAFVYADPITDITDRSAVRLIVFVRDSVDVVCQEISEILDVLEIEDVGDRVYSQGKFGYQSKHLLIRLGDDRKHLIENSDFGSLVCEIQVRTILQHAWAEMEHDIQYKGEQEIPLDLKKRFSALAGLLELADREFQNIQRDSDNLLRTVKAELINDLTQQGLIERSDADSEGSWTTEQSGTARELVAQGKYTDAITIYSEKIKESPNAHTLYIGRAKAKFLAGEVRGAISDLGQADVLSGGDMRQTARLRALIEHGDDAGVKLLGKPISGPAISQGLHNAIEAMRLGDGVKGFEEYTLLDSEGYNKAFVLFGKAMCCTLEQDTIGARNLLDSFALRPATPMAINIAALRCIIDIMEDSVPEKNIEDLEEALANMTNYSFESSPLKYFLLGLFAKGHPRLKEIEEVLLAIGANGGAKAA